MTDQPSQFYIDRKTIVKNILTLFSGSAISQVLTSLFLLLTARQLGPEQFGQYASSLALATSLSIVFSLGLNLWLLREGGRSPTEIGRLLGSVLVIKSSIGMLWLGAIYIASPYFATGSLPPSIVKISAVVVLLTNLFATTQTAYKARLQNHINAIMEVSSATVQLIVVLLLIGGGDQSIAHYIQARAIVLLLSLALSLIYSWYVFRFKPSLAIARSALIASPPYAATELLAWSLLRADLLIIALKLDDYATGIYSTAEGIIKALFIVPSTVSLVLLPVLSNLFTIDIRQAWITARRTVLMLLLVGSGMFILTYFVSFLIPLILGSRFTESVRILQILSPILLLHSITFGISAILVSTGQQSERSFVQFIVVILNIALNLLVIDRYGITGVAIVYVFTEILLLVGYSWLVVKFKTRQTAEGITT